jgi:transforming growth factor-beta-induced protein
MGALRPSSLGPLRINGVDITSVDVPASNGVVHVIDKVLIPSETIAFVAFSQPDTFSTLVELVAAAGLLVALNGAGPLTV